MIILAYIIVMIEVTKSRDVGRCIVLTGGGTAGHVLPHFALLPHLSEKFDRIFYIGSKQGIERELVQKYNENLTAKNSHIPVQRVLGAPQPVVCYDTHSTQHIVYYEISCEKLRRSLSLKNLLVPFKVLRGVEEARAILEKIKPDVVFSKGGFVAYPVVRATAKLGIPVVSHESDMSMGLANRMSVKYCGKICTTFADTAKQGDKFVHTGSPIRQSIYKGDAGVVSRRFETELRKKNLLILGGSLGAAAINRAVQECVEKLVENFNVIHVCGRGKIVPSGVMGYFQLEYVDDIENFYAWADVVVSRAGSNALCELMVLKKPTLFIPLASGRGDQVENAEYVHLHGACGLLYERDLTPERFLDSVADVFARRAELEQAILRLDIRDGSLAIMDTIYSVLRLT